MEFLSQKERDVLYYREKRKFSEEETAKELKLTVEEVGRVHSVASLKVIVMTGMTPTEIVKIAPF